MFEVLAPQLAGGRPMRSVSVHALGLLEGSLAAGLEAIQDAFPQLDLGSYPFERADGRRGVALVAKGIDEDAVRAVEPELVRLIESLGATPLAGEPAP
jgi:molybdopterin-biosynthesis enzyme MoeA-like protein